MMKDINKKEFTKRAEELVSQMTLDEKVFQTLHSAPAIERLGIKAYNWWNEALHGVARAGVATVFPQAIGMAAAFDEEIMEKVGDLVATEGRAKFSMQQKYGDLDIYKGLTFWAPNVNIFRDPRWGRGHETFGEDPYLSSRLGIRYIEGIQGHDERYLKAAACAKHFAVHSGPEEIRHSFNAEVSKQDMYETYLPAFKACVREGEVEAVMGAYNRVNGEPCCGSKTLLQEILRDEWGFEGHVTSDCWAIKDFHEYHGVTNNAVESVALAMNQGCDLNCGNIFIYLKQAVEEGLVKEERLDEALIHLFTTRMKLGLFDEPEKVPYNTITYKDLDTQETRTFNREVAEKSIVLLKNEDGLLPLKKDRIGTIGVIGPNANSRKALVGNYEGTASRYVTVAEGIQEAAGEDIRVFYSEGCHLFKDKISGLSEQNDRIAEVKAVCEMSDVVIACMGLDSGLEGEEGDEGNEFASGDKPNLKLPGLQEEVLRTIIECKKPTVLVLLSGSALAVSWEDENIPAILEAWYPGAEGGHAVADILFGEVSPEGKLPVTFYRTSEELPEFTDYSMKGRTYRYMEQEALYPFGYGLSYTSFELSDVRTEQNEIRKGGEIKITAKIKNTGDMKSAQTIQVYVKSDREGTPNPQLKALKKVTLMPEEVKEIELILADQAFGLYDENGVMRIQKGCYKIYVGMNQPDKRSVELTGQEPVCMEITSLEETVL